jgi:hypothetical protein
MKKIIYPIAIIVCSLGFINCKETKKEVVLTKEITFKKEGSLIIKKSVSSVNHRYQS